MSRFSRIIPHPQEPPRSHHIHTTTSAIEELTASTADELVDTACIKERQKRSLGQKTRSQQYYYPYKKRSFGIIKFPKRHPFFPKLLRSHHYYQEPQRHTRNNLTDSPSTTANHHQHNLHSRSDDDEEEESTVSRTFLNESTINSAEPCLLVYSNEDALAFIEGTRREEQEVPDGLSLYFFDDIMGNSLSGESLLELVSTFFSNITRSTSFNVVVSSFLSLGQNFIETAIGLAKDMFGSEAEETTNIQDVLKLNGYSVRTSGSIFSLNSIHMNLENGKKMMINVSLSPSSLSSRYNPEIIRRENKWAFHLEGPERRRIGTGGMLKSNKGFIEIQPPLGVDYTHNIPINWTGPNEDGQIFFEIA